MTNNMQRLAIQKASRDAVPDGGGIKDVIKLLTDPKGLAANLRAAQEWAKQAVQAVRNADDPNPWRNATDEEIAGVILKEAEAKHRKARAK